MAAPRHLAVIPDGNRRWARARGLPPTEGHREGIRVIGRIAAAAWRAGVEHFTFWWGSPANLTLRAPDEVAAIVGSLAAWLRDDAPALLAAHDARLAAFGRYEELCPEVGAAMATARAGAGPRQLTVLMAYDGREELEAAARVAGAGLRTALWTASLPPVDLLIRTGGEPHLSAGFMMWHIADSLLAFPVEPWPAFDEAALARELAIYSAVERRFGQ
jgi:undecaprenyl diphosphate synthase